MEVNLKNFIPKAMVLTPLLSAMTFSNCTHSLPEIDEEGITIGEPVTIPYYPPATYDSTTLAKLDSLLTVAAYKADSIKNSSNNQAELDSLMNDTNQKAQDIINQTK